MVTALDADLSGVKFGFIDVRSCVARCKLGGFVAARKMPKYVGPVPVRRGCVYSIGCLRFPYKCTDGLYCRCCIAPALRPHYEHLVNAPRLLH